MRTKSKSHEKNSNLYPKAGISLGLDSPYLIHQLGRLIRKLKAMHWLPRVICKSPFLYDPLKLM